jgi:hypothetical protein
LFSLVIHGNYQLLDKFSIIAFVLFLIAIGLYSISLSLRDVSTDKKWIKGLIFSLLSGFMCATQGVAIGYYSGDIVKHAQDYFALAVPWGLIFLGCSVVFIAGHYIDILKQNKRSNNIATKHNRNRYINPLFFSIIMSAFYLCSIAIYNLANDFGDKKYNEEYIGTLFMGLIIISSTVVSYINKEWSTGRKSAIFVNIISVILLILSIVFLGISAY